MTSLEFGDYWIIVQNYAGSGAPLDTFTLEVWLIDEPAADPSFTATGPASVSADTPFDTFTLEVWLIDEPAADPSFTATGPASVSADTPFDIQIAWNFPELKSYEVRYGHLKLVDLSTNQLLIITGVLLNRMEDDVSLNAVPACNIRPGDVVSYTIDVQMEPTVLSDTVKYTLVTTLPNGMTFLPATASALPAVVNGNQVTWIVWPSPSAQVTFAAR